LKFLGILITFFTGQGIIIFQIFIFNNLYIGYLRFKKLSPLLGDQIPVAVKCISNF
jgi:hypothetical protein